MKVNSRTESISLLLEILDHGYEKKAWHGPNLKGALRGVSAKAAAWKPAPGRHNIGELLLHAAYWKYAARRRLRGEKPGSFPIAGSNWFASDGRSGEKAWRKDRGLLEREHRLLRATIAGLRKSRKPLPEAMLFGVAFHDVYHAGQIQLLKRLQARRG
jgi:DinB superfamily